MPYIDFEYYKTYAPNTELKESEAKVLISRACDIIDSTTQYRIKPLSGWNEPTQELIKKAVAATVEYAEENGGLDVLIDGENGYGGSVRIGSFGYGDGRIKQNSSSDTRDNRIPQSVYDYLLPTGLLDVGFRGGGCG